MKKEHIKEIAFAVLVAGAAAATGIIVKKKGDKIAKLLVKEAKASKKEAKKFAESLAADAKKMMVPAGKKAKKKVNLFLKKVEKATR